MNNILQEILEQEQEDHTLNYSNMPMYGTTAHRLHKLHEKIGRAMGNKFLEELTDAESDVSELENLACFRHGYRLSGRLLTELFSRSL